MIPHDALILLLFAMAVALGYQSWSAAERRREDAEAAIAWCEAERAAHELTRNHANRLHAALWGLLLSADAAWEENGGGHDWHEACEAARAALEKQS